MMRIKVDEDSPGQGESSADTQKSIQGWTRATADNDGQGSKWSRTASHGQEQPWTGTDDIQGWTRTTTDNEGQGSTWSRTASHGQQQSWTREYTGSDNHVNRPGETWKLVEREQFHCDQGPTGSAKDACSYGQGQQWTRTDMDSDGQRWERTDRDEYVNKPGETWKKVAMEKYHRGQGPTKQTWTRSPMDDYSHGQTWTRTGEYSHGQGWTRRAKENEWHGQILPWTWDRTGTDKYTDEQGQTWVRTDMDRDRYGRPWRRTNVDKESQGQEQTWRRSTADSHGHIQGNTYFNKYKQGHK